MIHIQTINITLFSYIIQFLFSDVEQTRYENFWMQKCEIFYCVKSQKLKKNIMKTNDNIAACLCYQIIS